MPKGPCIVCGATDYPMSMGGPSICPACDCGIPPEVAKAKREAFDSRSELVSTHQHIAELEAFKEKALPILEAVAQGEISDTLFDGLVLIIRTAPVGTKKKAQSLLPELREKGGK